jgi:hypothetical protein
MQLSTYITSQGFGLLACHPLVYGLIVIHPRFHHHGISLALGKIATTLGFIEWGVDIRNVTVLDRQLSIYTAACP